MIDPSARVHPTADLESEVSVGPWTSIWHRAQVRRGARIGARDVAYPEGIRVLGIGVPPRGSRRASSSTGPTGGKA